MNHQHNQLCDNQRERNIHPVTMESAWATIGKLKDPKTVDKVLASPDKAKWLNALEKEV